MAPLKFPDRAHLIQVHRQIALSSWAKGDFDAARRAFPRFVESVRQQNINTDGELEQELAEARAMYAQFSVQDPLYFLVLERALPIITAQPGILQTDLYRHFEDVSRDDLVYIFYFADHHGRIARSKKGRTYELRTTGVAPSSADDERGLAHE